MGTTETKTLLRIGHPRFHSFSEAAEAVIDALSDAVPGTLLLGQIEPDEQVCRVIDSRGADVGGVEKGAILPLGPPANGGGHANGDGHSPPPENELDWDFLNTLGLEACIGMPLEMSDGRIVGTLSALSTSRGAYSCEHLAMLSVAARLLGHEWESVERRAELRRLRERLAETANVDPETGLADREAFLELLDREWRLAERGTVESVLVAFRIGSVAGDGEAHSGGARNKLALKIAAEVLGANARTTDHVGRTGEGTLAAILVGCGPAQVPAFVRRFEAALERVTGDEGPKIELSQGVQALAGTSSGEEALGLADAAAGLAESHEASRESVRQGVLR